MPSSTKKVQISKDWLPIAKAADGDTYVFLRSDNQTIEVVQTTADPAGETGFTLRANEGYSETLEENETVFVRLISASVDPAQRGYVTRFKRSSR